MSGSLHVFLIEISLTELSATVSVGCAYADDTLTAEQAVLAAYWRGRSIVDAKLSAGAMAAVGLSWEQCVERCPPDVVPACHNAADSVTVRTARPILGLRDNVYKQ